MGPPEKSSLKRARNSTPDDADAKKPRRSARLSQLDVHEDVKPGQLPSPVTRKDTDATEDSTNKTVTRNDQEHQRATPVSSPQLYSQRVGGLSSPPSDTQAFSQFVPPPRVAYEVEDEKGEGVWGYLLPCSTNSHDVLVLRRRAACPVPENLTGNPNGREKVSKKHWKKKEEQYEKDKGTKGVPAGGYLIGRHHECDRVIPAPTVSNRHALLFPENKHGDTVAVLEDLSGNGTFVNEHMVGRNHRRELLHGDEISILGEARFIFRYPRRQDGNGFDAQYSIHDRLGRGHFATVFLAVEKSTGIRYAVKKFERRVGPGERSKLEGLQQEIAVLMGVSHPNMLCLKDTFDEDDGVYLVLELAPEGELFNWIVMKQKLTEVETRKVFIQLFQGVKYLHERNIVHRDIKPENILLIDKDLHIKLADFGLAKIIGEESFTTTLCGTPSYVAPEILEQSNRRRYTRAVDVWSLGVVLYICLCGFPPFSDELYSPENPYTLSQQIKAGRFDYPSPYWDPIADPALDLIDRMLTVDVDRRVTIEECLQHPWITMQPMQSASSAKKLTDSTDGLTGALADFSLRKPVRERTLLSSINEIRVERVIDTQPDAPPVRVWGKNSDPLYQTQRPAGTHKPKAEGMEKKKNGRPEMTVEAGPDSARNPQEFMNMGGRGDEVLFDGSTGVSRYPEQSTTTTKAGPPKGGE